MRKGEKDEGWKFTGSEDNAPGFTPGKTVTWSASEYIEHDKSTGWFAMFLLVAVLIIGGVFLITRDITSVLVLGVLAVAFGVFAARKPNVLQYQVSSKGVMIGQKFYPISLFRSFAVVEEGPFRSINLLPMKRFMPSITIYYDPDDETNILGTFGELLPQETRNQDPLDKLMHRIRF